MTPIAMRINALLAEKGIPKHKFYEDCGISSSAFSQWSTGRTVPKLKSLQKIADYLGTDTAFLVGYEKEKPATDGDGQKTYEQKREELSSLASDLSDWELDLLLSVAKTLKQGL